MSSSASTEVDYLFQGPGEMRQRCRALDWAKTKLGASQVWSQSLRTAAQLVLASPFPNILLWGEDLTQLYNDGYRQLMGNKHPLGLGQSTQQCWPEVWHINQPIYQRVWAGESFAFQDALYPITRSGALEDAWFSLAYSPVLNESGGVGGILVTVVETTQRLHHERQQQWALLNTEEKYHALFDAIDEGFCLVDLIDDEQGQVVDYRFVEVNQVFERQTGLVGAAGKTVMQIAPLTEPHWLKRYETVARTGQPVRFENYTAHNQRWYTVFATRVGPAGSRQVAIVFDDITDRKRQEKQQTFLLQLSDALRPLGSPIDGQRAAMQLLGEHLGVDRVVYATINSAEDYFDIVDNYASGSVQKITGRYPFAAFGPSVETLKAGEILVISDVKATVEDDEQRKQFFAMQVQAVVAVPLIKNGTLVLDLSVHQTKPRQWRRDEIELIQETAERTWAAVERAKAEAARLESEKRLRLALEATELATWEWHLETDEVYWNERHFRLFGMEPRSGPLSSDEFIRHVHPQEQDRIQTLLAQAIAQRSVYDAEFLAVREDGSQRWMSGYGRIVEEKDGQPICMSGVMLDITERKATQEALRQSEQALAELKHLTLLSQTEALARMGSWEYHRHSGQFSWSAGMYQLTRIDPERPLTPELYLALATEADRPQAQSLIDYLRDGQGQFEGQLRIWVANTEKTLRIKADVIGQGEATRVVGVDLDFTQQLRAQQQIRETAESLQAVLNSSPASIGLLKAQRDETGQLIDFRLAVGNDKLARFFDEPLADLLGQPARRFSPLLWDGETLSRLQHIFITQQGHYEEKPLLPPHQDTWVALSVTQQDDGVMLTVLDITALKQAQRQQQHWFTELEASRHSVEALSQLKLALQHRSESLRAVSHDLKSNFSIINSAISLLELADSEAEREQFVSMALRNVQQATGLLSELLDLTRLETGEQARRLVTKDVSSLFRELGENLTPLAQQQGLALRFAGPDQLEVETDELLLYRLVQNLTMNALKYTHQGRVAVAWGRESARAQWWFRVEDTGSGLAAHLVERLNAPALRPADPAQPDPTRSIGSTEPTVKESWASLRGEGIGLRIVREIAHLLGARLQVRSEVGKGTQFVVHLPLTYSMS